MASEGGSAISRVGPEP